MTKLFIYALYNIVALVIILFVLFYLNTFVNDMIIPISKIKNNSLAMIFRFVILIVEGFLLLLIVYQINKRNTSQTITPNLPAITMIVEEALIILTCVIVFYQIYQHNTQSTLRPPSCIAHSLNSWLILKILTWRIHLGSMYLK